MGAGVGYDIINNLTETIMANLLSFEQEFVRRHPQRCQILRYMRAILGKREVEWSDLTKINLIAIADYIKYEVSANSAVTYLAILKGFLNLYMEDVDIPCKNVSGAMKAKKVPQQNVALTEVELMKIEQYHEGLMMRKGHQAEKDCLTLFLIEAFCGARTCDVEKLTVDNIANGKLTYVSQKTKTLTTLPAHSKLARLIMMKPTKEYSLATKNRVIKRAAERCGIDQPITIFYHGKMQTRPKYEYIGTHSARRSFISILIDKGVPIAHVSKMAGHSSIAMTMRYYCSDKLDINEEAMKFFEQ